MCSKRSRTIGTNAVYIAIHEYGRRSMISPVINCKSRIVCNQANYVITGTSSAGNKRRKLTKGLWNITGKDADGNTIVFSDGTVDLGTDAVLTKGSGDEIGWISGNSPTMVVSTRLTLANGLLVTKTLLR